MILFDFQSLNDFLHRKVRPAVFFFIVAVYLKVTYVYLKGNLLFHYV